MKYLDNTVLEQALSFYITRLRETMNPLGTEDVPVTEALGRISALAVYARQSSPHYTASAMDGIALKSELTSFASEASPVKLANGKDFIPVDTGDPLPDGTDTVMMVEDLIDEADGLTTIMKSSPPWENVRQIGEDICEFEMIIPSGEKITPAVIGSLLAGGVMTVKVKKIPVIAIIPTGDEIVPVSENRTKGKIGDFNSPMFASLLHSRFIQPLTVPVVPDQPDKLKQTILSALTDADGALVIAGSSAGRDDYTSQVIGELGETVFHGLAIRPGKPAILGIIGGKPVAGLPGYPVSGMIVMEKVILPALETVFQLSTEAKTVVTAVLTRRIVSSLKYEEFVRVRMGSVDGKLVAIPLDRGAGVITSFMKADGLLTIPLNSEGLEAGDRVQVELMKPLMQIERSLLITGSHDPLIDELADLFRTDRMDADIKSSHVGSMGGVTAVKRGETHLAGVHLIDEENGTYNYLVLKKYFQPGEIRIIKGVKRTQGIMTAPANVNRIRTLLDLKGTGIRYVNRQKGSGTRILFDLLLKQQGILPAEITDYNRVEVTHLGVAAAIAEGKADAGLGIYAAARAYGLSFIPVCDEDYDFIISAKTAVQPVINDFIRVLQSESFIKRLEHLGGYKIEAIGKMMEM